MGEIEGWLECEAMGHVGPELDATVQWRDLGLMCEACYAAYGDTRPLQRPLREALEDAEALAHAVSASLTHGEDSPLADALATYLERHPWSDL